MHIPYMYSTLLFYDACLCDASLLDGIVNLKSRRLKYMNECNRVCYVSENAKQREVQ